MKLTGKIFDSKSNEPLFGANIYVSDKKGKILYPTKGIASNPDGKYTLSNVLNNSFVTISYMGYKKETYPIQTNSQNGLLQRNFGLIQKLNELQEFSIIEYKDKPFPKQKNKKVIAFVGIGLISILLGTLVYKKL